MFKRVLAGNKAEFPAESGHNTRPTFVENVEDISDPDVFTNPSISAAENELVDVDNTILKEKLVVDVDSLPHGTNSGANLEHVPAQREKIQTSQVPKHPTVPPENVHLQSLKLPAARAFLDYGESCWILPVVVEGHRLDFLVDSGATKSLMDTDAYKMCFPGKIDNLHQPKENIFAANETIIDLQGEGEVVIEVGQQKFPIMVAVAKLGNLDGILGMDFLKRRGMSLEFGDGVLKIDDISICLTDRVRKKIKCSRILAPEINGVLDSNYGASATFSEKGVQTDSADTLNTVVSDDEDVGVVEESENTNACFSLQHSFSFSKPSTSSDSIRRMSQDDLFPHDSIRRMSHVFSNSDSDRRSSHGFNMAKEDDSMKKSLSASKKMVSTGGDLHGEDNSTLLSYRISGNHRKKVLY